jgi:MtfA peptidase
VPLIIFFLFIFGCILAYFFQLFLRFGKFEALRILSFYLPFIKKFFPGKKAIARYPTYLVGFPFYQSLPADEKAKFISRLNEFQRIKRIEGDGIAVTEKMRVQIAACAIQLLFGQEEFYLPFFDTIIIYPSEFRLGRSASELSGVAIRNGSIHISWKEFEKGYNVPGDAYNVGLYSFAQAMQLGVDLFSGDDPALTSAFREWQSEASRFLRIPDKSASPIPRSARRSQSVFFASCVEYFFEAPERLRSSHPALYSSIAALLRQDPIDKSIKEKNPAKSKLSISWRKQRKNTYIDVFFFCLGIVGVPVMLNFASQTAVYDWLLITFPIVAFFGFSFKFWNKPVDERVITRFALIGALGRGLFSLSLLLILNTFTVGEAFEEKFRVVESNSEKHITTWRNRRGYRGEMIRYSAHYVLANNKYSSCSLLRYYSRERVWFPEASFIKFTFRRGLFGFKVLEKTEWYDEKGIKNGEQIRQSFNI